MQELESTVPRGGVLRLNVTGDFLDASGAPDLEYLEACNQFAEVRPDVTILAYTHAWQVLDPGMFRFAVSASCETVEELETAMARGWPTVLVDPEWQTVGTKVRGAVVLACLAETRGLTCAECRLCARGRRRSVVAFIPHGADKNAATAAVLAERKSPGRPSTAGDEIARMRDAHREHSVTMVDLLASGLLATGDVLHFSSKSHPARALVAADGTLILNGKRFSSPSTAGVAAMGYPPVNGWLRWSARDVNGRLVSLAALRRQFIEQQSVAA